MFSIDNAGSWLCTDGLTFGSLNDTAESLLEKMPTQSDWLVDLSKVDQIDSAGLALLVAFSRHAYQNKIDLRIKVPKALHANMLIQAYGLSSIITLSEV